jgi:hypothetical protein
MDGRLRPTHTRVVTHPSGPSILAATPAAPTTVAPAGTEPVLLGPAPVDPAIAQELDATAAAFVESLVARDAHGPALAAKVGAIARMGDRELREAAATCNRILDGPRRDDAASKQQMVALLATMGRLQEYALLAERLDQAVERRIPGLGAADPHRAGVLRQDVRPHLRQRRRDLLAGLAAAERLRTAFASVHATVAALQGMRATVAALERASGSTAVDGGGLAPVGTGELVLPASIPPAGVLPASLSGGD